MDKFKSKEWNYHPDLPLADPSPFTHLNDPIFLLKWFYKNWLSLSERVLMVIVATALWFFVYPSLEDAKTFHYGWILKTYFIKKRQMKICQFIIVKHKIIISQMYLTASLLVNLNLRF